MTLRTRLLLGMALVAVVLAVSAVAITRSTRSHLVSQIDAQLAAASPRVPGGPRPGGDQPPPRLSELYVGRVTARGVLTTVLTPNLRGDTADTPQLNRSDITALRAGDTLTVDSDGSTRYRMAARRDDGVGAMTVIALSLDDVDETVQRLVVVEAAGVMGILAVLGLVTWWVIGLGVRPIRQMTQAASTIAAGDLSGRVPEATSGTEAGALSAALNGMLGQIEVAFDERVASEARLRQFVADASHELRTPVTTIRGYAELYRTGALGDEDELSEAMRRTEQEAVRMGSLVDDLLHLARLDQGRPLAAEPVDLAALAADAARDALAVAPDRSITVDAPRAVIVSGDEPRLRQVIANLVGNALVHAPGAPVRLRVTHDGGTGILEVRDEGPGMEPADAARAFERFYRADASRSRHRGGSGLGLAIVEATVRGHHGTAAIETEPGQGTTVRVTLPTVVEP